MKYLKLLLPALLIALMLLVPIQAFAADNPVQLYLNDKKLEPEVPPQIVNNITLVPVRIISQELGAEVGWDEKERKVSIRQDRTLIEMNIDNPTPTVNGNNLPAPLEAAPTIVEGNTLVPIRFIAEQFGLKVGWDSLLQSVLLYKTEQESASSDNNGGQAPDGKDGGSDKPAGTPPSGSDQPSGSDKPSGSGASANPNDPSKGIDADSGAGGKGTDTKGNDAKGGDSGKNTGSTGGSAGNPANGSGTGAGNVGNPSLPVLTKLEVSGETIVIATNGDATPKVSTLNNPYRIIIDLPNTALGAFAKPGVPGFGGEIAVQHAKVEKIRYALFKDNPSTVRVVLDMKTNSDYQFAATKTSRQWTVSFQDRKYTVVVDAGHGGSDPGASSINSKPEKDFTLPVANKVYKLLQQEPSIRTLMTRTDDTYPTLDERVELANSTNADLFLSIHGNSFKPTLTGTETYYTRTDSIPFANVMHKWLVQATGFDDRGVREANYKVTRETTMPAVLMEVGYLSNAGDEAQMYSEPFQDRVAAAIVNGIKEQLRISGSSATNTANQANNAVKTESAANAGSTGGTKSTGTASTSNKQSTSNAAGGTQSKTPAGSDDRTQTQNTAVTQSQADKTQSVKP